MSKFWTFQGLGVLLELRKHGKYLPCFTDIFKHKYTDDECKITAYNYILQKYNELNKTNGQGLVFGITEFQENPITYYSDYVHAISEFGAHGISSCCDDIYVLELEIPDTINLTSVDFYRFSDLIYYTSEPEQREWDGIHDDSELSKKYLFTANGPDENYELKQSHIHKITTDMIKGIYRGVEYTQCIKLIDGRYIPDKSQLIYSNCKYLEYFRKTLINREGDGK